MNTNRFRRVVVAGLVGCAWGASLAGQVVVGGVSVGGAFWPGEAVLGLDVSLIPVGEGLCAVFLNTVSSGSGAGLATRISGAGIAEEYRFYHVAPGVRFDVEYVRTQVASVGNNGEYGGYDIAYEEGQEVYLAFWDDRSMWSGAGEVGVPDGVDLYGWLKLGVSLGEEPESGESPALNWRVLESATARGGGIVVGTLTQIPEPSVAGWVAGVVAAGWGAGRRRRFRL